MAYTTESIGAFAAKTRLSELLARAERGESFVITKHGRPVARLCPEPGQDDGQMKAAVRRLKSFRGSLKGVSLDELLTARDDGRRF